MSTTATAPAATNPFVSETLSPDAKTWGEKSFDWLMYKGVGTYLNYLMSIGVTDIFNGATRHDAAEKDGRYKNQETTSFLAAAAGTNWFGKGVFQCFKFSVRGQYQCAQRSG